MTRVVVAMSGGVDSSVAAALLLRDGHEVVGMTLELGTSADPAAAVVGRALGIPHHVIDARQAFTDRVLRPSWDAYAAGRTPSPCLVCNLRLKFAQLVEVADRIGAELVATGHYARVDLQDGVPVLRRARHVEKDQSYFLALLPAAILARTRFPLGELTKPQVREIATRHGLPTAQRAESQDACFVTDSEGLAETLRAKLGAVARPGLLLDRSGARVGDHAGIHRYTIGQRRGLGVALGRPAFVVAIDPERAGVVLSTDPRDVLADGLVASDFSWLAAPVARGLVQIRSTHPAAAARIESGEAGVTVWFDAPQRAITPGQAVVIFDADRVLGGGFIDRALRR